jgi:hypothetical protein
MKLHWQADPELSAVRAAVVVATGTPCTDPTTEQLLIEPVTEINHRLISAAIDHRLFWSSYLDRSVAGDDATTAIAISLLRGGGSELLVDQTARGIGSRLRDARDLFFQRFPKLNEQLPLRIRPLRERWETIGPGLLREVERQVWQSSPPTDWWPASVQVSAVQPLSGGNGGFDPDADVVWIEAMLTDADPAVPEVLRLVWLVTALAIETHIRSRTGQRMVSHAWSLVSVPLVLTAALRLEMFVSDRLPIATAMRHWGGGSAATSEVLAVWWQRYLDSNVPLPLALKQLEKLLNQSGK